MAADRKVVDVLEDINEAVAQAITDEIAFDVTASVTLGNIVRVATEITRPADTTGYFAGDAVNTSTSAPVAITLANAASANDKGGYIVGVRLSTDKKSIVPRFRVHFYKAANPTLSNDNAQHQTKYADEAKKIGYLDLPAMITPTDVTNSDMSYAQDFTMRLPFLPLAGGRDLYAALETRDAFTPASAEKFTLTVWIDQP